MESIFAKEPGFVPRDAPALGLVPVRFHEFTDEAEANAYAIADNRLSEVAEWDDVLLGDVLAEIRALDERMLLLETGFRQRGDRPTDSRDRRAGDVVEDPGARSTRPMSCTRSGRRRSARCGRSRARR